VGLRAGTQPGRGMNLLQQELYKTIRKTPRWVLIILNRIFFFVFMTFFITHLTDTGRLDWLQCCQLLVQSGCTGTGGAWLKKMSFPYN
jgi:hypothetical protein